MASLFLLAVAFRFHSLFLHSIFFRQLSVCWLRGCLVVLLACLLICWCIFLVVCLVLFVIFFFFLLACLLGGVSFLPCLFRLITLLACSFVRWLVPFFVSLVCSVGVLVFHGRVAGVLYGTWCVTTLLKIENALIVIWHDWMVNTRLCTLRDAPGGAYSMFRSNIIYVFDRSFLGIFCCSAWSVCSILFDMFIHLLACFLVLFSACPSVTKTGTAGGGAAPAVRGTNAGLRSGVSQGFDPAETGRGAGR